MKTVVLLSFAAMISLTSVARADEPECIAGIAFIEAEIAKGPAAGKIASLERKLRIAERELGEKEWDECEEAVSDARKLVAGY